MSKGEGFYNPSFSSITEAVVRTVRMVGCLLLTTAVMAIIMMAIIIVNKSYWPIFSSFILSYLGLTCCMSFNFPNNTVRLVLVR